MVIVRAFASIAALMLCVSLAACAPADSPEGSPSSPAVTPSSAPRATPTDAAPTPTPAPTLDADHPVPKVIRTGQDDAPSQSSEPAPPSEPVTYPDGVSVQIVEVSFDEETAKGPGSFPGREFARLTLELSNDSTSAIDLGTSVLTVLDDSDTPVPPVYADEAEVRDFSGILQPGKTATAVYAFAVPASSRSHITLVVDFDADHTSAVFRGGID